MGLFDNLFLDANTPITINDGIDHSKDIVQPIVDPITSPGSSGDSLAVSSIPSEASDAGLVELFDSDKEEEKTATEILHPEPPKDIALEIGLGTPEIALGASSGDIDIGGDISFDIGGDMSSGVSFVDGSATDSGPSLASTEVVSNSIDTIADASGVANTLTGDGLTPSSNTPSDTALFSLLNNDPSSGENPPSAEAPASSSLGDVESTPIQSGDIVFSPLFDMSPDVPASSELELGVSKETPTPSSPLRESSAPLQSALTSLTTSPKLKAKISQFLGELESMEFGDQSEKEHKKQQIEMIRLRISEIKAESEMRIHALQLELQTLEREVLDMDNEKNRIKNVIDTFQKELDTA